MSEKILCVGEDPNTLSIRVYRLQKQFYIETASNGKQGLKALEDLGPFAVVVADMHLPDMNGIQFLARVKERSPDSVRIILIEEIDFHTALSAVNEGNVFRFVTKPCSPEDLAAALQAGLREHQLTAADQRLARRTLAGSVRMLIDIISLANPTILKYTTRITQHAKVIARQLEFPDLNQIELASKLSQIGCLALPFSVIEKVNSGRGLSLREQMMYSSHSSVGADLVAKIPSLEPVARIIEQQLKPFKKYTPSEKTTYEGRISLGAQILRVAIALDQMLIRGHSYKEASTEIHGRPDEYNPEIADALDALQMDKVQSIERSILDSENSFVMSDPNDQQQRWDA